jgi:AcrR family transcriptional regulator
VNVSSPARPGPNGPPNPPGITQTERRDRVLETAAVLAAEGGYEAVAMKAVADRSGVALATLYRWFDSKDQLLAEVLLRWMGALESTLRAQVSGDSPAARAAAVMRYVGDVVADNPRLAAASINALLSFDDGVVANHDSFHDALVRWIDLAVGPDLIADRPGAVELLEHVMFSSLIGLARGRDTAEAVRDRLVLAAHLLLD